MNWTNTLFINFFELSINNRLLVVILPISIFLLFTPLRNAAVRKQRRVEDNFDVIYLPTWLRLILFPMFLLSKKPFKERTVKYRLVNCISVVIAIILVIVHPNLSNYEWFIYILIFWEFLLLAIFKQYSRGGPYFK